MQAEILARHLSSGQPHLALCDPIYFRVCRSRFDSSGVQDSITVVNGIFSDHPGDCGSYDTCPKHKDHDKT
jgi:hypothetical protein